MKSNDFDRVAPFYDALASLVFGKKLKAAQVAYIDRIRPGSRVLIIGGGTGWILEKLLKRQPDLQIDYVEASAKMMERAIQRLHDGQVRFIMGTQNDIPGPVYDVIITHFFLDVFAPATLHKVVKQLNGMLVPGGLWLCADFRDTGKAFHRFLLWVMHRFFSLSTGLESAQIQDIQEAINRQGLSLAAMQDWKGGLIFSGLFQKG